MWLIAAHGVHDDYVANLLADPKGRVRHRRHWRTATAIVHNLDDVVLLRFNRYARGAPRLCINPRLIRIDYHEPDP